MPHIHEKIDFCADVYIVNNSRVLLRKHDKYKIWLSVGGHIELNEDPNEAVVREAKEEVGLDISLTATNPIYDSRDLLEGSKELIPPRFLNRHRINEVHEHISMIYFATATSDKVAQGATEISDEIRWFTSQELEDPSFGINAQIKYYAQAALKALS